MGQTIVPRKAARRRPRHAVMTPPRCPLTFHAPPAGELAEYLK